MGSDLLLMDLFIYLVVILIIVAVVFTLFDKKWSLKKLSIYELCN